jgi:hypothetical protein
MLGMYFAMYSSELRLSGLAFGWPQRETREIVSFSFLGREDVCPTLGR